MRDHVTRATYTIVEPVTGTTHTGTATLYGAIVSDESEAALRQQHHASPDAVVHITPKKGPRQ